MINVQAVGSSPVKAVVGFEDENGEFESLWNCSQKNEFILPFSPGLHARLPPGQRKKGGTK